MKLAPRQPRRTTLRSPDAISSLVIDDDEHQRALMERFLQREGFVAQSAADGETGLELARALKPRAILCDVMMPGLDGWSVLSALKADPELAAIPVVMVTFVEQRALAASLGAAEYVLKPVQWDRFKAVLDRYRPLDNDVLIVEDDVDTAIGCAACWSRTAGPSRRRRMVSRGFSRSRRGDPTSSCST